MKSPLSTARLLLFRLSLLGALALVSAIPFVAAPTSAYADEDLARQRFMEGREYFQEELFLQAAEKFREAYELSGRSALLYNVGQAYRRADELALAERYFQLYLSEQPDAANADEVVETIIEIQREQAARLATLSVTTSPGGAKIFVGDETEARCQSPCDVDLAPGSHRLRAELAGFHTATSEVSLQPREKAQARIALEASRRTGKLRVHADVNGATLRVGGQSYPVPTARPVEVEAGEQTVAIDWRGSTWEQTLSIEENETLHLFAPVGAGQESFSPLRAGAIGLGGASIALGTAAFLMGRQAQGTHTYLQGQYEAFGQVDPDLVQAGRSQQRMTNGLVVGALVTLGAGLGLWTWDMLSGSSTKKSDEPLEPTPEPEPNRGGGSEIDLL